MTLIQPAPQRMSPNPAPPRNRVRPALLSTHPPRLGFGPWFGCVAFLSLVTPALAATADHEPAHTPAKPIAKVIPWLEVNAPTAKVSRWWPQAERSRTRMSMRDYALEGIGVWATITDTVIISSRPSQASSLYPYLMRRKPQGVRIIGGLKTFGLPGAKPGDKRPYDFADANSWRAIARSAREVARITETNIVVLENETTLGPFTRGKASIDYAKLKISLAALRETGIEFWWNLPRILGNSKKFPDRRRQTEQLVRTISEALPNCVFLGGYTAWHDWAPGEERRATMLGIIGQDRMQDRLLMTPDGFMHYPGGRNKRCFTPAEAVAQIPKMPGKSVNIYCGGAYWVSTARAFVDSWNQTSGHQRQPSP